MPLPIGIWDALQRAVTGLFGKPTASSQVTAPGAPRISGTAGPTMPRQPAPMAQAIQRSAPRSVSAPRATINTTAATSAYDKTLKDLQALKAALLRSSSGKMPSSKALAKQAKTAVALQYDPQIAAIKAIMSQGKKETREGQAHMKSVYDDLAKMYADDIKQAKEIANYSRQQDQALLTSTKDSIKDTYSTSMDSLKGTLQQLGIQDAGGESMGDLAEDMSTYQNLATSESQAWQNAINMKEQADLEYYSKGDDIAIMASVEARDALERQLQDFLLEQTGKVGQLNAQKALSYNAALSELQSAAQKAYQDQQKDTWNQLLKIYGMEKDIAKSRASTIAKQQAAAAKANQKAKAPTKWGSGFTGAANFLTWQFTNDPYDKKFGVGEASRYVTALRELLVGLGNKPGSLSNQQLYNYAAQEAKRRGMSERLMIQAMAAYLGKG